MAVTQAPSADNLMAVTYSDNFQRLLIFAFIYLSHQWDTVLPMTHVLLLRVLGSVYQRNGYSCSSRQYCRRRALGGPRLSPRGQPVVTLIQKSNGLSARSGQPARVTVGPSVGPGAGGLRDNLMDMGTQAQLLEPGQAAVHGRLYED